MPAIALDLVAAGALVALLVVAYLHPPSWVEGACGLAGAALVLGVGAVGPDAAEGQVELMLPVVLFLVASLVVAELCAAEGVFGYLGSLMSRRADHRAPRLLAVTLVVASLVTVVLSLDATVVLLTPVAIVAGGAATGRAPAYLCARLANSASLLLPVSNLTNLLALPQLDLGFVGWAAVLAVPWLVAVLVEYVGVRLFFRRDLRGAPVPDTRTTALQAPTVPLVVLGLMLIGFAVASPLEVHPFWVAGAAALVLAAHALRERSTTPARLARAAHLPFGLFVLGLGVVVAAVSTTFLGDLLRHAVGDLVPNGQHAGLAALLLISALATLLANLVNNLPATLLLVPLVAPLGTAAVLAALVGVNVGAGLTYTGSLANLLWRRVMGRSGQPASTLTFQTLALVTTPVAVVLATAALWAEAAAGWF